MPPLADALGPGKETRNEERKRRRRGMRQRAGRAGVRRGPGALRDRSVVGKGARRLRCPAPHAVEGDLGRRRALHPAQGALPAAARTSRHRPRQQSWGHLCPPPRGGPGLLCRGCITHALEG